VISNLDKTIRDIIPFFDLSDEKVADLQYTSTTRDQVDLSTGEIFPMGITLFHDHTDDSRYACCFSEDGSHASFPFMRFTANCEVFIPTENGESKSYTRFTLTQDEKGTEWRYENPFIEGAYVTLHPDRVRRADWVELEVLEMHCGLQYLEALIKEHFNPSLYSFKKTPE